MDLGTVVSSICTAVATQTGKACYPSKLPTDQPAGGLAVPYTILYLISGAWLEDFSPAVPSDGHLWFQVTSVAKEAQGLYWMVDKARTAMLTATLTISGHTVGARWSQGPPRTPDVEGTLMSTSEDYFVHVTAQP